jgi:hypothetical protein
MLKRLERWAALCVKRATTVQRYFYPTSLPHNRSGAARLMNWILGKTPYAIQAVTFQYKNLKRA